MPLPTTIGADKELVVAPTPVLLATFTFPDATTLRVSSYSHEGANAYLGNDYLPRVKSHDLATVQAEGFSKIPRVTLTLSDGDGSLYSNWEVTKGFGGAVLDLVLVTWDPGTADYSSDESIKFHGVCDPITSRRDDGLIKITARTKPDLAKAKIPPLRLQRTCPWAREFPKTTAARQAAADDPDAPGYRCGYSPDATGGNERGNFDTGPTPFLTCSGTRAECVARLGDSGLPESVSIPPGGAAQPTQLDQDELGRTTGRFAGVDFIPEPERASRSFGGNFEIVESRDSVDFGVLHRPIPVLYGHQWITPIVVNSNNDANQSHFEVIIASHPIDIIDANGVVVNGVIVRRDDANDGNVRAGRWSPINLGDRDGSAYPFRPYDGQSSPYGSLTAIAIDVAREVADGSSLPNIRILLKGKNDIRVYSNPSTFVTQYTENPIWQILDVLRMSKFKASDADINDLITAAAAAAVSISYERPGGATGNHARFSSSFALDGTTQISAQSALRGLLETTRASSVPNKEGKLSILVHQTLADQQPAPIAGSNYTTAIDSIDALGAQASVVRHK